MFPVLPPYTAGRLSTLVALILLCAHVATAQPGNEPIESSGGTTYVVAFPDTTKNTFDARYPNQAYEDKAMLFVYSGVDNEFSIRGAGVSRAGINIQGGRFTIIDLMGNDFRSSAPLVIDHCKPVDNTFRIEADQPIVVYQYLVTKFGTEAWTAMPVEAWGNEYYAAANAGEVGSDVTPGGEFDYNRKNKAMPAEILVIAAYDDTRLTILPSASVRNNCSSTNITLKAGQAYSIQSHVDTLTASVGGPQPDFGGSRIFATKPIGVITGNTRSQTIDENVGLGKNIFKNMLIEWVAPVEQHGTQFVYMPTWDTLRPTGAPGEDPAEKRKAEFVRVYGTHGNPDRGIETQGYFREGGTQIRYDAPIALGEFNDTRHKPDLARVHYTDLPAQAMMYSAPIIKYAGTTQGFGNYIGAAYEGHGGYMVELTPREQWVGFAPYYASSHPAGMVHSINVVTDTSHMLDVYLKNGERFSFRYRIEGTDLIWGSMAVQPGVDQWLEGRNGARFAGYVYGRMGKGGREEYRPGRAFVGDDPPTGAHGGGDEGEDQLLHPSEYEEYLAIAYGYPLAPSRLVVGPGDSLGIKTESDCSGMTITITALNDDPVGLRSVRLDNAVNATVTSQQPFPVTGAIKSTVRVAPINSQQDASATIVIKDKTGKITTIPFTYFAERVELDPVGGQMNFGVMTVGSPAQQSITITNPIGRAVTIRNVRLARNEATFRILQPTPLPLTLAPQQSRDLVVEAAPTRPDAEFIDTVLVELECMTLLIPLKAETMNPCVMVDDLDFGTLQPGQSRSLPLRICNEGGGTVSFSNPSGPAAAVLTWLMSEFTVSPGDLAVIRHAVLERGDCITITVSFSSGDTGTFRDVSRVWASTRRCRDTSVWSARVYEVAGAEAETGLASELGACEPNPFTGITSIPFTLAHPGHATLVLYDERGERVMTLVDEHRGAGEHVVTLDGSRLPAGVYHCRLSIGDWSQARSIIRK